jgi:hypothetical protein
MPIPTAKTLGNGRPAGGVAALDVLGKASSAIGTPGLLLVLPGRRDRKGRTRRAR